MKIKISNNIAFRYLCFLFAIISLSTTTVKAQLSTKSVVNYNDNSSLNLSSHFKKVEDLFFREMYSQCLLDIENAKKEHLTPYEKSILHLYESICSAYMLKSETKDVIETFILNSVNPIYRNIAMAILAQEHMKKNDYENAEKLFKRVNVLALSSSMAMYCNYYYGKMFFDTERYPEAQYRFSQANKKGNKFSKDILYYLSYIKYNNEDYEGAADGFNELSKISKYDKTETYLAQIRFKAKNYEYIINNIDKLLELTNDNSKVELYRIIGESYYYLGSYLKSIEWISRYKDAGGALNQELNYMLGYNYYMNNLYSSAIEYFTKILEGETQMTQNAYYHLADSYLKVGNKPGALRAFSMAASIDIDDKITQDALYNQTKLSYELGSTGMYSQLIEIMQRFINKYPNASQVDEIKGYLLTIYINTSDYENAIAAMESIENPSNAIKSALQRMCYEKALECYSQRDYTQAITLFDKTISYNIKPKYLALSIFWKAESMLKNGDSSSDVITLFERFLGLSTTSIKEHLFAHYNIGYIHYNNRNFEQAERWFRKFIDIYTTNDSNKADALSRIADIQFKNTKYNEAIELYKQSKNTAPTNSDYADYQIALSYGFANKQNSKINQLKSIIKANTSIYLELAMIELASTYNRENKYSLSEQVLGKYVKENKDSPFYVYALMELGLAASNQNKSTTALGYYKEVVQKYKGSKESNNALLSIKSIYISEGKASQYFDFMKSVGMESEIDNSEKEQLSFEAIQHQYLTKKSDALIALAIKFRKEFPNATHTNDVTFYFADALHKSGRTQEAIKEFEKIVSIANNQYAMGALIALDEIYSQSENNSNRYEINEKLYKYSTDVATKQKAMENLILIALNLDDETKIRNAHNIILNDALPSKTAEMYAYFGRAKISFKEKDYVQTYADLKKSSIPISQVEGAESQYMKAVILFSEKKYNDTEKLIISFSDNGTAHQYWVAKCFILLGDVYIERNDLFQAKATYQSIIDGYGSNDDGIIELAKEKASKIKAQ